MSNNVVGNVYQSIIEDVISASRVDFEENGVEEGVLADLRQGWQRKLTQYNVAQFPWDPKPDPEAGNGAAAAAAALPAAPNLHTSVSSAEQTSSYVEPVVDSNVPLPAEDLPMPSLPMPSLGAPVVKTEPGQEHTIKLEPDAQNGGISNIPTTTHVPPPNFPMPISGGNAAMRAVQQLQHNFGQRAAASINAIQSGMQQQPSQPGQQQQQQRPAGVQQMTPNAAQQYRAQVAAQQAAQLNHGGANGVNRSQMDGAGDEYEGVLMQQRAAGEAPVELGRVEIDGLLHKQILQQAKVMEGGGLMMPLRQATKHSRRAVCSKGKEVASAVADNAPSSSRTYSAKDIAQVDGLDEDDDDDTKEGILVDEDAINSDLDDPDEDQEDDDDDDDMMGPIMLCVYDKVQRVKNKWKCTLKDGVLTVNGKEYVFHKATGEYEW